MNLAPIETPIHTNPSLGRIPMTFDARNIKNFKHNSVVTGESIKGPTNAGGANMNKEMFLHNRA